MAVADSRAGALIPAEALVGGLISPALAVDLEAWLMGHRSPHTTRCYREDLRQFLAWVHEAHGVRELSRLTVRECVSYPRYLRDEAREGRGYAPATIARKVSAARVALDYAVALDVLPVNPMDHVKAYYVSDVSPRVALSEADVRKLLAAPDRSTKRGARDYAILMCLCYMALRRAEVASLTCGAIQHERGHTFARVRGKGERIRRLPIVPAVAEALRAWLQADGRGLADGEPLQALATRGEEAIFHPLKNNGTDYLTLSLAERNARAMSGHGVWLVVKRAAEAAGLTHDVHTLRHTALSQAIDAGADLLSVQDFAGHADPRTTRRYLTRARELDTSAGYRVHY